MLVFGIGGHNRYIPFSQPHFGILSYKPRAKPKPILHPSSMYLGGSDTEQDYSFSEVRYEYFVLMNALEDDVIKILKKYDEIDKTFATVFRSHSSRTKAKKFGEFMFKCGVQSGAKGCNSCRYRKKMLTNAYLLANIVK